MEEKHNKHKRGWKCVIKSITNVATKFIFFKSQNKKNHEVYKTRWRCLILKWYLLLNEVCSGKYHWKKSQEMSSQLMTAFVEDLLEKVTDESRQKHQESWEMFIIILNIYFRKSYRKHPTKDTILRSYGQCYSVNLIFVVPCIMLYNCEISPTRCKNCVLFFAMALHVSGDNLTHHQDYICCIWPQVSRLT